MVLGRLTPEAGRSSCRAEKGDKLRSSRVSWAHRASSRSDQETCPGRDAESPKADLHDRKTVQHPAERLENGYEALLRVDGGTWA